MINNVTALKQTIQTDNEIAFKALLSYEKFTEDQLVDVLESFDLPKAAKYTEAIFNKPGAIDLSFKSDGPLVNTIIAAADAGCKDLAFKLLKLGTGELAPTALHAIIEAATKEKMNEFVKYCLAKYPINASIVNSLIRLGGLYAEQAIDACPDINIDENGKQVETPCICYAVLFCQDDLVEVLMPLSRPEDIEKARKLAKQMDYKSICGLLEPVEPLVLKPVEVDAFAKPSKKCSLKPGEIDAILAFACEKRLMTLIDDYAHLDLNLALDYAVKALWAEAIDKLSKAGAIWKFQSKSFKIVNAE